ncbi:MAG: NrfD/PsrC family molybdoenzyme membrane anchor subunit [Terriglobia bacterium]
MPGLNVPLLGDGLNMPWGDLRLILDFFLGGLGAGAFITAFVARLINQDEYRGVTRAGAYIAPIAVILGLILLISEMGTPLRAITVLWQTHASSVTSWGSFLQAIFVVFLLIYAWIASRPEGYFSETSELITGWITLALAVLIAPYHGYVLSTMTGRELWNGLMTPAVFTAVSLSTGLAMVMIFSAGEEPDVQVKLGRALAVVLGAQLLMVVMHFSLAPTFGSEAQIAAGVITSNVWLFWIGILLVGLLAPLIIDITAIRGDVAAATGSLFLVSLLVLVGGFLLRYGIIVAGQALQLTP